MKKLLISSLLLAFSAVPLQAGFDEVVAHVSKNSGLKRTYIPFLGIARLAVWVAAPEGVHDIRLAVFEGRKGDSRGELSSQAIAAAAGKGWQPFVQSRSKRENTTIYAKPDGKWTRLLVVTQDANEASVIEVKIDPDRVAKFVADNEEK